MTLTPLKTKFIYSFKYDYHHDELCKLESRQIFDEEEKDNLLFTDVKVTPTVSPFIKNRFEIIANAESFTELVKSVNNKNIHADGFKAEYLILEGDSTGYAERLEKLREIGFSIEGKAEYYHPSITYSICIYNDVWYFGIIVKNSVEWQNHKQKPYSFSNSICLKIAKTLISIATKVDKSVTLLDSCCGVGTILLEACYSGFNIEGCEISYKAWKHTMDNLAHYDYTAIVYNADINQISNKYDAVIIDLPYNLYSYSNDEITLNIIESSAKLTERMVIVSISDIEPIINNCGFKVTDYCTVEKRGKSTFQRKIWVCEKESLTKTNSVK